MGKTEPETGSAHPPRPWRHRLRGAVLIWGGTCALVFLGVALVEHLWFREAASETLDLLHLIRGVLASLVTTAITATYLLRQAVPSLESSLGPPAGGKDTRSSTRERLVTWLIGLRWVAVLASAAVVSLATWANHRVEPGAAPYLWGGVVLLAAFNAILSVVGAQWRSSQAALAVQVAGDVAILGWLIHHAGGLGNPFAGFFVFHAVLGSIVLAPKTAYRVAAAIATFVLGLATAEVTGVLPPGCLRDASGTCSPVADRLTHAASGVAVAATVMGCAVFVVALMRVLQRERDRLAQATATLATHAERLAAAQAQVHREREKLQAIIDCMADAVVYVSPNGMVWLCNRAAERFFPQQPPAGEDLRACHPPEKWDRLLAAITTPGPSTIHPVFEVDGRSYEANYAQVHDTDGSLRGVVMVARDVTEQIQAQKWRMQEERMSVVGKLAAGLAHELNNPLGAIALFAQHALTSIERNHPLADHLGTVLRNANLCKRIVRDLLEYARQRPPQREQVSLGELLGDIVRTLEPSAEAAGVALRREVAGGSAPPEAWGDPDQLRQILVNLGLNAIDAMPGGGTLTFRLSTTPGSRTRIEVVDTGMGIPLEEQERIFSAFHTTKPEGTGLGLTVARDLVTAHGGSLQVTSSPGQGTTFTVELPARAETQRAEAAA